MRKSPSSSIAFATTRAALAAAEEPEIATLVVAFVLVGLDVTSTLI